LSIKWHKSDVKTINVSNISEEINKSLQSIVINNDIVEKITDEKLISSTCLNENEINELNSESDIDKLFDVQNDEEFEVCDGLMFKKK
jgi:hypothetical protein